MVPAWYLAVQAIYSRSCPTCIIPLTKLVGCFTNIKMKTVPILMKKTIKTVRSKEDTSSTKTLGVYCTQRDCGKVSVQQTERNIETQYKKYMRQLFLGQKEASALAEPVMDAG
jgi:hypothetical protein